MTPERIKVFVAEDDSDWNKLYIQALKSAGHKIVANARTLEKALAAIETLGALDVAVVDGNLSPEYTQGKDGTKIAEALKKKFPNIKVFGVSRSGFSGADVNLGKDNVDRLLKMLKQERSS